MATRKNRKNSGRRKESVRQAYARMKREFSAADLQKYTEIEQGVPLEQVIAECETIHRTTRPKRK